MSKNINNFLNISSIYLFSLTGLAKKTHLLDITSIVDFFFH